MREEHGRCIRPEGCLDYVAGIDTRLRQCSPEQILDRDNPVPCIESDAEKNFVRQSSRAMLEC